MPAIRPTMAAMHSRSERLGRAPSGALALVRGPRAVLALLVLLVSLAAWALGAALPVLGPAVLALLVGALVRALAPVDEAVVAPSSAVGTRLLQVSIVALGLSVDAGEVLRVAGTSLPVMLGTLAIGLAGITMLGRALGVAMPVRGLLTVGTSICGASAIAAVAPVLGATSAEIGYAVSVIFVFNISAVVVFPAVAHAAGFAPQTFAIWAGTAVNDTSSVLAAAFAFGAGTAAYAAVVKLSRTLMILPVTVAAAVLSARGDEADVGTRARTALRRALPWFIVAFLGASLLNTAGLVPDVLARLAATVAQVGTVLALASVGLGTHLDHFRQAGPRPLLLGLAGWVLIATTSLALQGAVGLLVIGQ